MVKPAFVKFCLNEGNIKPSQTADHRLQ